MVGLLKKIYDGVLVLRDDLGKDLDVFDRTNDLRFVSVDKPLREPFRFELLRDPVSDSVGEAPHFELVDLRFELLVQSVSDDPGYGGQLAASRSPQLGRTHRLPGKAEHYSDLSGDG